MKVPIKGFISDAGEGEKTRNKLFCRLLKKIAGDNMIAEIECYKGDCFLCGKMISFNEFKRQTEKINEEYDRNEDNFISLLCRRYNWEIVTNPDKSSAELIYDRDTEQAYMINRQNRD